MVQHLFSFNDFSKMHLKFLFIFPIIFYVINQFFSIKLFPKIKNGNIKYIFMTSIGEIIVNGIILIYKKLKTQKQDSNKDHEIIEYQK